MGRGVPLPSPLGWGLGELLRENILNFHFKMQEQVEMQVFLLNRPLGLKMYKTHGGG